MLDAGRRPFVTEVQRSYLVCSTPRSGTTLLCHLLTASGVAGRPEEYYQQRKLTGLPRRPLEYFDGAETAEITEILGEVTRVEDEVSDYDARRFADYAAYLDWTFEQATTPNGVFGAKLMWGYFNGFVNNLRGLPGHTHLSAPELLASVFPKLRYVAVTRTDKVAQAVSLWKALQTWRWNSEDGEAVAGELRYSFDAIDHLVRNLHVEEAGWRGFFAECGIEPHVVVYDRLAADYEGVVGGIIDFLEIPSSDEVRLPAPRLGRQADEISEEWRARYLAAMPRDAAR